MSKTQSLPVDCELERSTTLWMTQQVGTLNIEGETVDFITGFPVPTEIAIRRNGVDYRVDLNPLIQKIAGVVADDIKAERQAVAP